MIVGNAVANQVVMIPIQHSQVKNEWGELVSSEPIIKGLFEKGHTFCLCEIEDTEDFIIIRIDKTSKKTSGEYMKQFGKEEEIFPEYLRWDSLLMKVPWIGEDR